MGIYVIVNKVNGKFYLGSSMNIERRYAKNKDWTVHHNTHLVNAVNKYGNNSFEIQIICECAKNTTLLELQDLEQKCLDFIIADSIWDMTYNISKTVVGSSGWTHNEKTRKHLSAQKIGKKNPRYSKPGINLGREFSQEWCDNISKGAKGRTPWNKGLTKETHSALQSISKKMSTIQKGKEPWNKGSKLYYDVWNKGLKGCYTHPPERIEKSPWAKLKIHDVIEIRNSDLSIKQLVDKYNVSYNTIKRIIDRDTWKNV